jgi:hypothetical protein
LHQQKFHLVTISKRQIRAKIHINKNNEIFYSLQGTTIVKSYLLKSFKINNFKTHGKII